MRSFPSDGPKPLNMQLQSGEYKITGKDAGGKELSSSVIRISANRLRSTGSLGGVSMDDNGSCLTIGLTK